jgi:hypothetical protein
VTEVLYELWASAVTASAALDVRAVLRLLLFSLALVVLARCALQRNPTARRSLLLAGAAALVLLPMLLALRPLTLPVGVSTVPELSLAVPLPGWLLAAWLLPAALFMARTLIAARRLRREVEALPDVQHPIVVALADDLAEAVQAPRPRLKIGTNTGCLTGGQPLIVLAAPLQGAELPDADLRGDGLRAALVHELIHLRRRDDRALRFAQLVTDLYWWMPWLRSLACRVEQAIEESCDDRAADFFSPGHRYLEGVLDASRAEQPVRARPQQRPPMAFMSAHPLLGRVLRFGRRRDFDPDWPGGLAMVGSVLLGLLVLTGLEPVPQTAPGWVQGKPIGPPAALTLAPAPQAPSLAAAIIPAVERIAVATSGPRLLSALRAHQRTQLPLPIYPGAAIRSGIQAEVAVRYEILRDGSISQVQIIGSDPAQAAFAQRVRTALGSTRYPPLRSIRHAVPFEHWQARQTGPPLVVTERYRFRLRQSL